MNVTIKSEKGIAWKKVQAIVSLFEDEKPSITLKDMGSEVLHSFQLHLEGQHTVAFERLEEIQGILPDASISMDI